MYMHEYATYIHLELLYTYLLSCDTTSAFYRRGKTAVFKMFERQDLIQCAEVFKKTNSTQQEVITNGIRFLLSMYGAPKKLLV